MARRILVPLALLFAPGSAWAGNTAHMTHLVKTTQPYGECVDGGVDAIFGFACVIVSHPGPNGITIAPGSDPGHQTTSAEFGVVPTCWMNCSSGQCCADFSFRFLSLLDVGTWKIDCDCLAANPAACAGTCTPTCDPSYVYNCSEPLHYIVDVFNSPPTASITHDPAPAWNATVHLHAHSNDPDGGALKHAWSITHKPASSSKALSGANTADPSIAFTSDADLGDWTFQLLLDDNEGERKTFTHTFKVPNVPPSIAITGPASIDATNPISLQVTPTTDVDGGNLTFAWDIVQAPPGASHGPSSNIATTAALVLPTTDIDIGVWKFHVTATDNESTTGTADHTIEVKNIPPEIHFSGSPRVEVGDLVQAETTFTADLDGGALTYRWDIVQAPGSGTAGLQTGYSSLATISMPTTFLDAGTWVFELTVTDNEGVSVKDTFSVLVNAPPQANIDGPGTISFLSFPLVLDGRRSWDPDSDCPLDPAHDCHVTDGRPVAGISGGVTQYTWSLIDIPIEQSATFFPGRVDDALGVTASGPTATIPFSNIKPGQWGFSLEIADAETTSGSDTEDVLINDPNVPPLVFISPSARFETTGGVTLADIAVSVFAVDLDNFLLGDPTQYGTGISDYAWSFVAPAGCGLGPSITSGATLTTLTLFAAGAAIPPACMGTWSISVDVTDDDTPAFHGSQTTYVTIGNCPTAVCINAPTTVFPAFVELASDTDVMISYFVDATLYDDPLFSFGLFTRLDVFPQGSLVPVFTAWDPNVLASTKGSVLAFHWNGYGASGALPQPGFYTVVLTLDDALLGPTTYGDAQLDAIWIEVAEVKIGAAATRYVERDPLEAGTSTIDVPYQVLGSVTLGHCIARVRDASSTLVAEVDLGAAASGTFHWDGKSAGVTVPPGEYTVQIEALSPSFASFGKSVPHQVIVYYLSLTPAAGDLGVAPPEAFLRLNGDDDDVNGVRDANQPGPILGENDLVAFSVVVLPTGVPMFADLRFDVGAGNAALSTTAVKTAPFSLATPWDLLADTIPANVFAEGIGAGDATLTLEVQDDTGFPLAARSWVLHVAAVDLDLDTDMDGTIGLTDDGHELDAKAMIVNVNNDDSDGDGNADHLDNATNGAADVAQLTTLLLRKIDFIPPGGKVELRSANSATGMPWTAADRAPLRIFDDAKTNGVIGPKIADGGPDKDVFAVPTAKITAGDLSYAMESFNHGNVLLSLVLLDGSNHVLAADDVKVVANVDRDPAGAAVRYRINGSHNHPTTTLMGMRGNIASPEAKADWSPAPMRTFASTNVWFSVQDMGTVTGDYWIQTGLAVDRNAAAAAATTAVYFEVNTGTAGGHYYKLEPAGGWTAGDFSAAVEDVATGKVVARIGGVQWDSFTHVEWKTRRLPNYQFGSEMFHSVDQNPGTAANKCVLTNMQVNDAGVWGATAYAAADVKITDIDKNGAAFNPATSPEWAYTFNGAASVDMWDQVVEY